MRFFLDTFVGDGSKNDTLNPFQSAHADGDNSIIDLRGVWTVPDGLCLVGAEGITGTPLLDLGDTLDQRFKGNIKRLLANQLGLLLDQTDFRGIIAELMLLHGREDGTRWRPLQQNASGRHEIYLGNQKVYDAPVVVGTLITESFNTADSDTLGPDLTWTELRGDIDIVSNQAKIINNGHAVARAETALDSADHYAQSDALEFDTDGAKGGPCVRFKSDAETLYEAFSSTSGGQDKLFIRKVVEESETNLAGTDITYVSGDLIKAEINGSTLKGYFKGVEKLSETDTTITGNLLTGIKGFKANMGWDNFEAGDLAAAAAVYPPFPRRQRAQVRM